MCPEVLGKLEAPLENLEAPLENLEAPLENLEAPEKILQVYKTMVHFLHILHLDPMRLGV